MKWITSIIFFTTVVAHSQETKFVLKNAENFVEEYYVLVKDKKVKHGTYLKYKNGWGGFSFLETGNYAGGKRTGEWQFFYDKPNTLIGKDRSNSLKEKGYYVEGKKNGLWVTFYLDTLSSRVSAEKYSAKKKTDPVNIVIEQNGLRPKLAGEYLNDERVGEWVSLDFEGNVYQRYDFSNDKLILDLSIEDSLNYNTNRRALFIGGLRHLNDLLVNEFSFQSVMGIIRKDSTRVTVEFSIQPTGRTSGLKIYKSNAPDQLEKEVLRVATIVNNNWLPALQHGQPVESNHRIGFDIIRKTFSMISTYKIICLPSILSD